MSWLCLGLQFHLFRAALIIGGTVTIALVAIGILWRVKNLPWYKFMGETNILRVGLVMGGIIAIALVAIGILLGVTNSRYYVYILVPPLSCGALVTIQYLAGENSEGGLGTSL